MTHLLITGFHHLLASKFDEHRLLERCGFDEFNVLYKFLSGFSSSEGVVWSSLAISALPH